MQPQSKEFLRVLSLYYTFFILLMDCLVLVYSVDIEITLIIESHQNLVFFLIFGCVCAIIKG